MRLDDWSRTPATRSTPRFRALTGTVIYGRERASRKSAGTGQAVPGGAPAWADFTITLDQTSMPSHFGDDYIAGGAGDDVIFGQLGNDTIQGDGSIEQVDGNPRRRPSRRRLSGVLHGRALGRGARPTATTTSRATAATT